MSSDETLKRYYTVSGKIPPEYAESLKIMIYQTQIRKNFWNIVDGKIIVLKILIIIAL